MPLLTVIITPDAYTRFMFSHTAVNVLTDILSSKLTPPDEVFDTTRTSNTFPAVVIDCARLPLRTNVEDDVFTIPSVQTISWETFHLPLPVTRREDCWDPVNRIEPNILTSGLLMPA